MIDFKYLLVICTVLLGGTLWLIKPTLGTQTKMQEKWLLTLLIGCCLLSLAHYTAFGEFHNLPKYGNQNFHPGEVYVYYMGSKYFKETGYFDLYACTSVAIREMNLEYPKATTPHLFAIRNLKDKVSSLTPQEVWTQYMPECHERFSPQRWVDFKNDLQTLFNIGAYDAWWRTTLFDAGYNSSPIFASLASPVANLLPLAHTWNMIGYIDFLLIAIAACFIYRAFGLYPLLGFLLIFGTNELSSYNWTGGSYFRHTWFASFIIALCLLKEKKYLWSGAVFAYSVGDRIFPLLFFVGALVPLAYGWFKTKGQKSDIVPFVTGFSIAMCVLLLISLKLYGLASWQDFFANMKIHNGPFWIPHVGLKKALVYYPGIDPQNFWYEDGLVRFNAWNTHLEAIFNSKKSIYAAIALFMCFGSVWVARKKSPCLAALLVGGTLFYVFLLPARYYYIYLSLFPVVAYLSPSTIYNNIRLALSFLLILILLIIPMFPPDDILLGIYFSYALGAFFVLQISTGLLEELTNNENPPH